MVFTVALNPSLDYVLRGNTLKFGSVNYADNTSIFVGGKAINVSIILKNLGIDNICIGLVGGFTGKEIIRQLEKMECKTEFVEMEGINSRINVKLEYKEVTEINSKGEFIPEKYVDMVLHKLEPATKDDIIVLAGSIPPSISNEIYQKIMEHKKDVKFVVDAANSTLVNTLKCRPFLIKPNIQELEEIFKEKLENIHDIIEKSQMLQEMGAKNVLVSMGVDGAVLLTETGEIIQKNAHVGKVVSAVGAGDSMVAGFIAGLILNNSFKEALNFGIAAGSATAFSSWLATREDIELLL